MILKLLLVLTVIGLVYFLFIKKKPLKNRQTKKREKLEGNDMVECKNCGIYAEVSDSILSGSSYYCSQECLKEAQ